MQQVRARQGRQPKPEPIEGDLEQAIARKLQSREITAVPGLPSDPEPQWYDLAIEMNRRQAEFESQREAQHQSEAEAATLPPTAAGLVRKAVTGSDIPLNGAAVLRAALAAGQGTINGEAG